MKMIFILLSLLVVNAPVWSQDFADDMYPETDPASIDGGEFSHPRGLPQTDFEEVPREEQEFAPEALDEEMAPEEVYESDEEYLE